LIIKAQEGIDLNSREAQKLGLMLFNNGIARCIRRIQGEEPVFLPKESIYGIKQCEEKCKELDTKELISPSQKLRKSTGYQD